MRWKTAKCVTALMLLCASTLGYTASTYRFRLDPVSSSVDAKVAFMGIGNRKAYFPALRGNVTLSPEQMNQIDLNVTIDATQLTADDGTTTGRLKGKDFFYVDKFPTVRFEGFRYSSATRCTSPAVNLRHWSRCRKKRRQSPVAIARSRTSQ